MNVAVLSNQDQTSQKALELFVERGFATVGMRELASHLGVAAGSIYYHIDSKQALLREPLEDLYQILLAGNRSRKSARALSANERLNQLVEWHLGLHRSKSLHFILAEREAHCLEGEHKDSVDHLRLSYEELILRLLTELVGPSPAPELATLANSIVSLLNNVPHCLKNTQLSHDAMRQLVLGFIQSLIRTFTGTR
ncbi:TPA: TetR/AcrR family transcriptional regulator [Pseudomonas aeruginosa]|nr:TetR/AcrR family transcriptional regulator [Pseudomonas aeruginosa]HEJ3161368.1 TetR/AcrR family transcriptional regulator [Pseudomonas aeruginosa]